MGLKSDAFSVSPLEIFHRLQWIFLLIPFYSTAQSEFNSFRSPENPLYWKNRLPEAGYWQQDVYYRIQAEIDDQLDIISGNEELIYWNNSQDTLEYVYFHLYQNAFQPGSYLDNLTRANGLNPKYSKPEEEKKGTVIEKIQCDGEAVATGLDNTVLKVFLKKPILPGTSAKFNISFKTYFGSMAIRRRMQKFLSSGFKHYNGAQWYPKISVYDRKFGWTADQHLNREFYGDYGSFDVELTLPSIYIVDASGILVNESEVLPDSLRKKLDIKNFKFYTGNKTPSMPNEPDDKMKTWHFHAENVHDFAFSADPTYRIGETITSRGVRCLAFAQEANAWSWQNASTYMAQIIDTLSESVGEYQWPKISFSDARDGMEYPMLVMGGGGEPGYKELMTHEIAHQWFYGMVGNNETYRAFLDEGFSQFIESEALVKLEGFWGLNPSGGNGYVVHFRDSMSIPDRLVFSNYMNQVARGKDGFLNTHSDQFNGALGHGGGYSLVYRKTATMLYNLQYVLGDSLFQSALKNYFRQWQFCHPYPEDFRKSFIHYTHVDLNWFFDQWLETDKHIDYAIQSVRTRKEQDEYAITFRRNERMQMPIDFSVTAKDGKNYDFHIPNRDFIKQTPAIVLPKWFGWDKLNKTYTATVHIPSGIESIRIDTSLRLADINMLNNSRPFPILLKFDSRISNPGDWRHYVVRWRPDAWYNNYDGVKIGLHLEGNYFNVSRFFDFNFWINSGLGQQNVLEFADVNKNDPVSVTFFAQTPIEKVFRNATIYIKSKILDGWQYFDGGMKWNSLSNKFTAGFSFSSSYRKDLASISYLLYPDEWGIGSYDNLLNISLTYAYNTHDENGRVALELKTSAIGSNYDYSYLVLTTTDHYQFGRFILHSRAVAQLGTGTDFSRESSLFLAGANGTELMNDRFTRSRGFVPGDWLGYGAETNHFQQGGGLNLRGYAGYLGTEEAGDGTVRFIYRGTTGWSFSEELEFSNYINIKPRNTRKWFSISTYLFADAGSINYDLPGERLSMSAIRADAGLGITATIKKFFSLQTVNPFTIRCDFPFWLNRPPASEEDFVKFRYVVGIGKTF